MPEVAVGLGQHERDAAQHRGQPDRPGDVAAAAEHRVAAAARAGSAARRAPRRAGLQHRARGRSGLRPAQPARRGSGAARSRRRGRARPRRARRRRRRRRRPSARSALGDRQRRHDVSGRPAGCDEDVSPRAAILPDRAGRCGRAREVRSCRPLATFSSSPIDASSTSSDRRARGDERQRHAGQRREAEHREDVQQRLAEDQRRDARRRAAARRRPRRALAARSPA